MSLRNLFCWILLLVALTGLSLTDADCPMPETPENGDISIGFNPPEPDMVPVGQVIHFECDDGYSLRGISRVICFKDGYRSKPPLCYRKRCSKPASLSNGHFTAVKSIKIIKGQYRVNSKLKAKCKKGFELTDQNDMLKCTRNGTELEWQGVFPVCKKRVSCKDPGRSPDGRRFGEVFYAGENVTYKCNESFELIGEESLICQPNGHWDHPRPRCKPLRSCPDPPKDPYRRVLNSSAGDYFVTGEQIVFDCIEGYEIDSSGQDSLYCNEKEDDKEAEYKNTDYNAADDYVDESEVVEEGSPEEVPVRELVWDDSFALCRKIKCERPLAPINGTIRNFSKHSKTKVFPYAFEINYECNQGYMLIGASFAKCDSGGWSAQPPQCKQVTCSDISAPENGYMSGTSRDIGAKVSFTCNIGFVISGPSERVCLENGKWDGDLATCTEVNSYCPNPGNAENGNKYGTQYDHGSEVRFECNHGYTLIGSEVRTCQKDRSWSGTEVICRGPLDFDRPDEVSFRMLTSLDTAMIKQSTTKEHTNGTDRNRYTRAVDLGYSGGNLVLYFLFDSSGSIGKENFKSSLNFAIGLIERIVVSKDGARIGAIVYNETAETVFYPWEFTTNEQVLRNLKNIKFVGGGGTATSDALKTVYDSHIRTSKTKLKNPKSIVFLLTDGVFNIGGNPKEQAAFLLEYGAEIFCIAVAGQKKMHLQSLYEVVGKGKEENVYQLNNYGTLNWMIEDVLNGSIDYSRCGVPVKEMEDNSLVGGGFLGAGSHAVLEQHYWPWMAALYLKTENNHELQCGGSLIDREWVLTAAHCLDNLKAEDVQVKLGLTKIENDTHLQHISVKTIYRHPKWNSTTYDYDVALLRLSHAANYKQHVRPICLSPPDDDVKIAESTLYNPGDKNTVLGFGKTPTSNNRMSNVLRQALVEMRSDAQCKAALTLKENQKEIKSYPITGNMICAGDGKGRNDTCQGDSGSPLMKRVLTEQGVYWVQLGIVSWGVHQKGKACTISGTYGFYTKISTVVDWIKTTRSKH